ncbi:MAG TPA: flagellar export chaperone FliS [Steroidobacteraceae bacterium]|nr:flagellar export chaperone FliS [Steroidobacteraceae bacterium]
MSLAFPNASTPRQLRQAAADAARAGADVMVAVLDGAIAALEMGRESLDEGQWQQAARQILATCQLLQALRDNVDVLGGDPLATNLAELYDYAGHRVSLAASDGNRTALDEVWHLLKEVRAAWFALPAAARMRPGKSSATAVQTWSSGPCSMVPIQ